MDLLLFGIQGSGKGTQAKMLAEAFGYDIFETGGELRKMAASGTELGNIVKSYIDQGSLAPIDIVLQVVKEAILSRPEDQKILFDGIPRDIEQMEGFNQIMSEVGRDFHCIQIDLDLEEGVQRILERAKIEGRADDADEATIRKRMGIFTDKTMPVIEKYQSDGKMVLVDGRGSREEVYSRLEEALQ